MKWVLFRNDEKECIASGYCTPYPPELGKRVTVGSLTARDGWSTTMVKKVDGNTFETLNSRYKLVPLEEYLNDKERTNQS